MEEGGAGQVGGLESSESVRKSMAAESRGWKCSGCGGRSNEEILREQEELTRKMEEEEGKTVKEEAVPELLKMGYREDIEKKKKENAVSAVGGDRSVENGDIGAVSAIEVPATGTAPPQSTGRTQATQQQNEALPQQVPAAPHPQPATLPASQMFPQIPVSAQTRRPNPTTQANTPWVDLAIGGIAAMLFVMVMKKVLAFESLY